MMTPQILYEDHDILVCVKPHGLATQSRNIRTPDLETLLKTHLSQTKASTLKRSGSPKEPYLAVIHRLDQPVAGILVFAKTKEAARELNQQLTTGSFGKFYHARVYGAPPQKEGTLEHYMVKDGRTNTSRICSKTTPGAKPARLHYRVLPPGTGSVLACTSTSDSPSETTLLEIHLDTGRHHQIRVQLAHMGCPIVGDQKYGALALTDPVHTDPMFTNHAPTGYALADYAQSHTSRAASHAELRLCACRLSFSHPRTGKPMTFEI